MLRVVNTIATAIERLIEILLATLLLVAMGSNSPRRGFADPEDFRQDFWLIIFFVVASGYIFSSSFCGIFVRNRDQLRQSWLNIAIFALHAGFFTIMASGAAIRLGVIATLGVCVVAFSSLVGGQVRAVLVTRLFREGVARPIAPAAEG